MLPRAPLSPRDPLAVVWTGEEVLVWGDTDRGDRRTTLRRLGGVSVRPHPDDVEDAEEGEPRSTLP